MSPTEFSNYIKQRAMQQQVHHSHSNGHNITPNPANVNAHMNTIGPVSPARSLSPNPLSVAIMNGATNANNLSGRGMPNDSYFYSGASNPIPNNATNMNTNMYSPPQYGRNLFESTNPYASSNASLPTNTNNLGTNSSFYSNNFGNIGNGSKYSPYMDTSSYYGLPNGQQQQQTTAAIERAAVF